MVMTSESEKPSVPNYLHPGQFNEGRLTPTFATPHMAPGGTVYGTQEGDPGHEADKALAKAYRRKSLAATAKGSATSHALHETSAIMNAGLHSQPLMGGNEE